MVVEDVVAVVEVVVVVGVVVVVVGLDVVVVDSCTTSLEGVVIVVVVVVVCTAIWQQDPAKPGRHWQGEFGARSL